MSLRREVKDLEGNNIHISEGRGNKLVPKDAAGFWVVCKTHPAAHIEIWAGGCSAAD
jgi:hypothetical protein